MELIIKEYHAYKVSDSGIVTCLKTGKEVKQGMQQIKGKETGYLYVTMVWGFNGSNYYYLCPPKRVAVHRLVCIAFNGNPPEGMNWVNHKDGNKANNSAPNLEWSSISDNIKHAYKTGLKTAKKGIDSPLKGRKASAATKHKQALAKIGEKHPKFKGWYIVNGFKYDSANKAAIQNRVSTPTIIRWCKQKTNYCYFLPKTE